MAASYSNFDQVIGARLQQFSPDATRQRLIALARRGRAEYLAGRSDKPLVTIETDGHAATSEDQVTPYGVISYVFRLGQLPSAGRFAKQIAREISPVVSGRYRDGWFLMADGAEVEDAAIPAAPVELTLVNDVPYARKIEFLGARRVGVPPGIVERVREHVLQRFGNSVVATVAYIVLPGGYVLKHTGEAMTYPALVMRARQ